MLDEMINKAYEVMQNSYSPYSNFKVGACLRSEGDQLFVGCNVENASYSLTQCAETAAIGSLISAGKKEIHEVVVIGSGDAVCAPCGACRQQLLEFAVSTDIPIHACNRHKTCQTFTLKQLLPCAFSTKNIERK